MQDGTQIHNDCW